MDSFDVTVVEEKTDRHSGQSISREIPLSKCLPGQVAVVKSIGTCSALLRSKLCSMGLCPGHEVKVLFQAPLKDPITIRVLGSQLALRLSEAAHIFVELKA